MRFLNLEIRNFRNISSASLNLNSEDIILTGINGQGKTNILEAIYLLCYGSSFRTSNLKECIKFGESFFYIRGSFLNSSDEIEKIEVTFSENKRKIKIDDKEIKDRKELVYKFPCIVFCHEDINFISGEPEERRRFFDQMMSLYSPLFFDDLRHYKSVLMQRNAAIKNEQYSLLPLYNERLATYGLNIMKERASSVYSFNKIFPALFKKISESDLDLSIEYQPSWSEFSSVDEIVKYLVENTDRDIKMSTTTSGIHRDRFIIQSQYRQFSSLGSTGQMRLCSIIFRIAQAEYFTKNTGIEPVALVDDVLLELDSEKRGKLIDEIKGFGQSFYTFLPKENYFKTKKGLWYKVEKGTYTNEN